MYLSGDVLRTNGVSAVVVDDGTDADPFESDPDNGIISYLSPLGEKILNAKDGEELNIEVNEQNYHYVVESIEAAEF